MRNELIDDVILSSRVRLARNFEDIPFPTMMNEIWAQESVRLTIDAVSQLPDARGYTLLRLNEMEKPAMQSTTSIKESILFELFLTIFFLRFNGFG